jgi:hypothetical protein
MAKHRQDLEVSGDFWAKEVDFFAQNRRLNERFRATSGEKKTAWIFNCD